MSAASDFARLHSLPPQEAIAYMAGRELAGETYSWADLWQGEHARAFTVSRLARADLLEALQQSLAKSVAGDLTRKDWIKDTQKLLEKSGWWGEKTVTDPRTGEEHRTRFTPPRLQLIYDTNARQAASAGQWQRMVRHQRTHPYARYVSRDDGRVRPLHRAWHGVTLPIDDAWWNEHRPPNGWRCRCRVVGVTKADYERGTYPERPGAEGEDGASAPLVHQPMKKGRPAGEGQSTTWQHPQTGEALQTPAGVDPGFAYNAGTPEARSKAFEEVVSRKIAGMEPKVRAQALKEGWHPPGLNEERLSAWRAMAAKAASKEPATGQTLQVHTLSNGVVQALGKEGIQLQDAAVWVRDSDLAHAMRDKKADRNTDLPEWAWRDLPILLQSATPYLDTRDKALLYAIDFGDRWGKVVIRVNYSSKGRFEGLRATKVSNFVKTGGMVNADNLQSEPHMVKLAN